MVDVSDDPGFRDLAGLDGRVIKVRPIPITDDELAAISWRVSHYGGTHLWREDHDAIVARIDQAEDSVARLRGEVERLSMELKSRGLGHVVSRGDQR